MTFLEEMKLAFRGVFALVTGQKNAPDFFDNSTRGLVGASIALIVALTVSAFVPAMLNPDPQSLIPREAFIFTGTVYLLQIGAAAIILNQFSRLDGFLPYLVADFWSTLVVSLVTLIPVLLNARTGLLMLVLAISVLIIKINIARLIIKLPGWHIVGFFVAHLTAGFIGLTVLGAIFGVETISQ